MSGLHVQRYGDGSNKIAGFHGWGADHLKSFATVIEALPDTTTFYGIDLPGYGRSGPPETWSYADVTQMLARGIDDLLDDGETITLLGACSGTYHVLEMARQRPHLVDRLVLVEPLAYFPWFFEAFLVPGLGRFLYKQIFANPIGRLLTQRTMQHQRVANDYNVMESFGRIDLEVPYRYLQYYHELGDYTQYRWLETPTRVLYGQNTWKDVIRSVDCWRETLQNLEPIELEGVGHLVNQEAPDAVVAALVG
jgi:pimeloyl-ACP methyl ester carboxylesterase